MSNHWHTRFQDENFVYGTEPNVFLSEMQKKLQLFGDALAIAEGEGREFGIFSPSRNECNHLGLCTIWTVKDRETCRELMGNVQTELVDLNEAVWE